MAYSDIKKRLDNNETQLKEELERVGIPMRPQDEMEVSLRATLLAAVERINSLESRASTLENQVRALTGHVEELKARRIRI